MRDQLLHALHTQAPALRVQPDAPMTMRTTFRIGGPADLLVEPSTPEEAALALQTAARQGVMVTVIGNGSNLLVRDGGIRGMVLCIGPHMAQVTRTAEGIRAEAGVSLIRLARQALAWELGGLAQLGGIPGTLGGAAAMNAGAYGAEMAQVVRQVDALTLGGEPISLSADALAYRYRGSAVLDQGLVVTHVSLALSQEDPAIIRAVMDDCTAKRRAKQPLSQPSAGSFFKRPPGHFAGALIEQAGLKGFSVGGAQVSPLHAGFVVNTGHATCQDVLVLMREVQRRVMDQAGVMLAPEVRILGEDAYLP